MTRHSEGVKDFVGNITVTHRNSPYDKKKA